MSLLSKFLLNVTASNRILATLLEILSGNPPSEPKSWLRPWGDNQYLGDVHQIAKFCKTQT